MKLMIALEAVGLYPDLVAIYLDMRVDATTGLKTLVGFSLKSRRR
jgi:hypothetical protein